MEPSESYHTEAGVDLLYGLMFPCPNGKVPYSLQPCYDDKEAWPAVSWVEQQIREKRIHFLGEV